MIAALAVAALALATTPPGTTSPDYAEPTAAVTNQQARSAARDSAPDVTAMRVTKVRVGHCELHGRFAACPVWAWAGGRRFCRYVVHLHQGERGLTVRADRLRCWA